MSQGRDTEGVLWWFCDNRGCNTESLLHGPVDKSYPTYSDIIKLAQKHCPMDGQLHAFIVDMCKLCGWSDKEMFRRIFRENVSNVVK